MRRNFDRAARCAALAAGLVLAGCVHSDTIAPDGATIDLSATPAQIVLVSGSQSSPVTILATVRDMVGVPLPGQDVRFTTSSGVLDPIAGTPVRSDDNGNATVILTAATQGPTITANSGKATATLTLTAGTGALGSITLSPNPLTLNNCSNTFTLTATAFDPSNAPVSGIQIFFEFISPPSTAVTGSFTPSSGVSDVNGEVKVTLDIDDVSCSNQCIGTGKNCGVTLRARDQGGTILSNTVTLTDNVP